MISSIESGISSTADFAGYIPVVSTVTGLTRVVYGAAKEKLNEVRAQNGNEEERVLLRQRVTKGKEHVDLGIQEAIPFGKLTMKCLDRFFNGTYD